MDNKSIPGIDNRPFLEVTNHERADYDRWNKALKYAAFGSIAIVGVRWASTSIKFQVDPNKFRYLSDGLNKVGQTPWYEVRGKTLVNGKIEATIGDVALELTKRFEELFGGIPRTFDTHSFLSRLITTTPSTQLRIPGSALEGAFSHYEALIGRGLLAEEKLDGFQVAPFSEADLENYVRSKASRDSIALSNQAVKDEVARLVEEGLASPGKTPGMFSTNPDGTLKELVAPDVNVTERLWNPGGPIDPTTGRSKYQHLMRSTDVLSETMGATPISHTNEFPFMVYKAPESTKLTGTTRDLVETFIDPKLVEKAASVMGPKSRAVMQEGEVFTKKMSERYLRMLDQPLEAIEDLVGKQDLFAGVRKTKSYSFLKNLFGTGGDYSGSTVDLWGRHAKRIVPLALGLTAAYELGSRVTELVSDKSLAQVGGAAVGASQRIYASLSDKLGLTSLNKAQEREAEGSHRLMGVLAFPLAGGLTGATIASFTNPIVAEGGKTGWLAAREELSEVPDALGFLKKDLPIVGDLSKPMTRAKQFGIIGAAIGGAMSLPFLLGALGSNQNYDEVVAEQRGETEVAVRKGAFWEMGRTDIEGEQTQYYRPGWLARLNDAPADELQFGDYADRPFSRMLKGIIDPYWREKELYYERPYPITGPDTSGFGPLGTLWGMTLGRVLKPPKIMHEDEVSTSGREGVSAGEVVSFGRNVSEAPSEALGGLGPALARSPYDQSFLAGEAVYKATEAAGLPGFVFSSVKKAITGSSDFGVDQPVLASFADVGSMRDNFWDSNVGGGFTTTEALRRFIPKERFQLEKVNPIRNEMPSWLPGPENYTDFTHGDPYQAIPEGEYRLPGSGYASRFKELADVHPEDYPDIHKYRILADIAPFSQQFKDISKKVDGLAQSGSLTETETGLYEGTKAELREREQKVKFREEPTSLIGDYWAGITKAGRMNPVEHLLPISPVHKFAGPVDAVTEYEDRNLYSTRSPSWDSPIQDFVKPALYNAAHILGYEGVPDSVQEHRDLTEYFDKLEYMKYKRLESNARGQGEGRAAFAFARKAEYTMFGADPYADMDTVKKVLPREELPFFDQFVSSSSAEEKGRILEMVPQYTRKFYTAQWQKQIYAGLAAKGNLNANEEAAVAAIESSRAVEGEVTNTNTWDDYINKVERGNVRSNTFPDYIRAKKLESYFDEESPFDAPKADWIGYHPAVTMDDVKLKVVQAQGLDFHDFDLWESDEHSAARKPYLDEAANDLMNPTIMREDILQSLTALRLNDLNVEIVPTTGDQTRITLDVNTNRRKELDREIKRYGR